MKFDKFAVVAEARKWLGTPFRHQGRSREHGVDCIGLIMQVAVDMGLVSISELEFKRMSRYKTIPDIDRLIAGLNRYMIEVPDVQVGDVAHISWGPGADYHVGFVSRVEEHVHVIHACADPGRVIESAVPEDKDWMRIISYYRFKEVNSWLQHY